jgi:uncharacterized protein (DUF488 family)
MGIFTIGHSTGEVEQFLKLLKESSINVIVDVRSTPYSKFSSQYNREDIADHLKKNDINYLFLGDSLGARNTNKELQFDNGKVCFKEVQKSEEFKKGIARLENGIAKGYNIALMCTEKEAIDCHRFALISEYLNSNGISVKHIQPDGVINHKDIEERLVEKYFKKIDFIGLSTDKTPLEQAYELLNMDIAYNDTNDIEVE